MRLPGSNLARSYLALLILGDALVFVVFAVLGMRAHEGIPLLDIIWRTSIPLMAAWFGLGLLTGAFRDAALRPPALVWLKTLILWLPAGILGLLLRSIMLDRELIVDFALVAMAVGGLLLVAWRTLYSVAARDQIDSARPRVQRRA
jgi:hypothetical protein